MIHPATTLKYINDTIGYGVFATQFIPEGTIVYAKDSLELEVSPAAFRSHSEAMQVIIEKYSFRDQRGFRIVSWDFAKYVNHCCNCNTISTGYGFEIAIRDIQADEEITDEYGIFNMKEQMEVYCGKPNCRRVVNEKDYDNLFTNWDRKIKKSLSKVDSVDQPLFKFLNPEIVNDLDNFLEDESNYKSVYLLKYQSPLTDSKWITK